MLNLRHPHLRGSKKNWNNPGKLNESFPDGLEDKDTDTDKDLRK